MASAVTGEEGYGGAFRRAGDGDWGGGWAPGGNWVQFCYIGEILEGVKSCTANNTQSHWF